VADLKLGPLPRQTTVRLTIVLLEPLKEELDAYVRSSTAGSTNLSKPQHWYDTSCRRSFVLIALGAAAENRGGERKPVNVEPARKASQT
jgi:hypothetical protein